MQILEDSINFIAFPFIIQYFSPHFMSMPSIFYDLVFTFHTHTNRSLSRVHLSSKQTTTVPAACCWSTYQTTAEGCASVFMQRSATAAARKGVIHPWKGATTKSHVRLLKTPTRTARWKSPQNVCAVWNGVWILLVLLIVHVQLESRFRKSINKPSLVVWLMLALRFQMHSWWISNNHLWMQNYL